MYGEVKGVVLAVDEKVGLPRGWARVEYVKGTDAEVAQHLLDGVRKSHKCRDLSRESS